MTPDSQHDTISVIIPVYNGERYLAEAIQSVLEQTLPAHEIIVIDDASTDRSGEIAQQFPSVRYERLSENRGAGAARNRGVELAIGNILTFLDADDVWQPQKLRIQHTFLRDQSANMVFCRAQQFISPDLTAAEAGQIKLVSEVLIAYVPGGLMISKADFERVGLFTVDQQVAEFITWYTRAQMLSFDEAIVDVVLLKRRLHTHNLGRIVRDRQHYLRAAKARLDSVRIPTPFNPVLQTIFDTQKVQTSDHQTFEVRAHVDEMSCYQLQLLVKKIRPKRILEVGFAYGISSMVIAEIVKEYANVRYDILDPLQDVLWHDIGVANMARAGFGERYTSHRSHSEIRLPMFLANNLTYQFAFIDGNHTFDHALIDFFYTNRMLEVGGIVVLDDGQMPSLTRLAAHIETYPCYQRLTLPESLTINGHSRYMEIPGRMVAFQKLDHDNRQWDWYVNF